MHHLAIHGFHRSCDRRSHENSTFLTCHTHETWSVKVRLVDTFETLGIIRRKATDVTPAIIIMQVLDDISLSILKIHHRDCFIDLVCSVTTLIRVVFSQILIKFKLYLDSFLLGFLSSYWVRVRRGRFDSIASLWPTSSGLPDLGFIVLAYLRFESTLPFFSFFQDLFSFIQLAILDLQPFAVPVHETQVFELTILYLEKLRSRGKPFSELRLWLTLVLDRENFVKVLDDIGFIRDWTVFCFQDLSLVIWVLRVQLLLILVYRAIFIISERVPSLLFHIACRYIRILQNLIDDHILLVLER